MVAAATMFSCAFCGLCRTAPSAEHANREKKDSRDQTINSNSTVSARTHVFHLVVAHVSVALVDLVAHGALALSHHDEVLQTQFLLVRQAARVRLLLEAHVLAALQHVRHALDL